MLLGEDIGCHELRVVTGEGGEDKFLPMVLIYRIGRELVFWEEIGKERGLCFWLSFFRVPELLIDSCEYIYHDGVARLLVLLTG